MEELNPISDNQILAFSKLKTFTDDKIYKTLYLICNRVENIVEKGKKMPVTFASGVSMVVIVMVNQ